LKKVLFYGIISYKEIKKRGLKMKVELSRLGLVELIILEAQLEEQLEEFELKFDSKKSGATIEYLKKVRTEIVKQGGSL